MLLFEFGRGALNNREVGMGTCENGHGAAFRLPTGQCVLCMQALVRLLIDKKLHDRALSKLQQMAACFGSTGECEKDCAWKESCKSEYAMKNSSLNKERVAC